MNSSQRCRRDLVESLCKLAHDNGLGSSDLRDKVHEIVTRGIHPDSNLYDLMWARADRIVRAGLMCQIYYLVDVMGKTRATQWLRTHGSVLDGFVRGFSSSPEEFEKDIGRDNVNWDGCVLSD